MLLGLLSKNKQEMHTELW